MAHNSRAQPFGTWVNGYHPTPTDLNTLDANQASGIDGDGGGAWMPSSAIQIGGSGLQLSAPLLVGWGGTLTSGAGGSGFNSNGGSVPLLGAGHAGASRTINQSFASARGTPSQCWQTRLIDGGLQAFASANTTAFGQTVGVPNGAILPLRPVDGSTLTQIVITFSVPTPHPLVPTQMPKVRVVRVALDGSFTVLTSVAAGAADSNGYTPIPTPTTGVLWQLNGAKQTLIVTCDQNNTIDLSLYVYQVEIVDELYPTTTLPFVNMSTPGGTLFSTPSIWTPNTVFAANTAVIPTNPNQNGWIYFTFVGGTTGPVEPNWFVDIANNTGSHEQTLDNTVGWNPSQPCNALSGIAINGITGFSGYPLIGFGTIWYDAVATYTGITDTRFQ